MCRHAHSGSWGLLWLGAFLFVRVVWESETVVYLQVGFCALVLGAPPRWFGVRAPKWQTGDSETVPWESRFWLLEIFSNRFDV